MCIRDSNWDLYDPAVTPLIEVCSKHGCGMSETAPYPYYHNMGPRDSRCTVYEGLKRGFHFGFVGSTDHHAGYPGSYGDGKLAVLAESKTRSAIWDGLKNRRTYAVTGDRIKCDFSVDGHLMGSIVPLTSPRHQISDVYKRQEYIRTLFYVPMPSPSFIRGMCIYLVTDIQNTLKKQTEDWPELVFEPPYIRINEFSFFRQIKDWCLSQFLQYGKVLSEYKSFGKDRIIAKAKRFIENNINRKISAEDVYKRQVFIYIVVIFQ